MNWRVLGASVCGTSHQKRSQPCQDAWAATIRDDGLLLAAVADGAGSATRSQDGAEWAVQAAIAYLADLTLPPLTKAEIRDREDKPSEEPDLNQLLTQALQAARTRVIEEAEAAGLPVRECASTLILLVANHEGVAVAQIGDGAAVMIDESGTLTALSQPQQGEYANQTTFLTSEGAIAQAEISIYPIPPRGIALFSDGLQRLALEMPQGTPHERFFSPLFQFIQQDSDEAGANEQLQGFLTSPRVSQRTDDDLTLVLAGAIAPSP
ncbi:protein phosphatase 2C domain-containing protein [Phormidium yuhuli AB48]|uniref:Protein phosphatase 2C domain-containing protein n=1 Tax=Phormidium yuhuli AB48 TaxID=2940671 RepID=A0ABY5ARH6_9CYAN|nr:PP2C family serine/threonine-protein phosphatase [Phormidium yuhuli]USR91827.1 protein phosphatase 2C domain-containing protein [Phormidium yuhuli AB48]